MIELPINATAEVTEKTLFALATNSATCSLAVRDATSGQFREFAELILKTPEEAVKKVGKEGIQAFLQTGGGKGLLIGGGIIITGFAIYGGYRLVTDLRSRHKANLEQVYRLHKTVHQSKAYKNESHYPKELRSYITAFETKTLSESEMSGVMTVLQKAKENGSVSMTAEELQEFAVIVLKATLYIVQNYRLKNDETESILNSGDIIENLQYQRKILAVA